MTTSRLKTVFNPSPIYSAREPSNHKLLKNIQNQSCTQIYIKQNIHKHRKQNFRRNSPFGITPVKKAHKARTRRYRGPFRRFINTRFFLKYKKGMDRGNKKLDKVVVCLYGAQLLVTIPDHVLCFLL